jgi:hypothetical protein
MWARVFLYEHGVGGVPAPQYDQLKNPDVPMVAKEDIGQLHTFWTGRCREVDTWDNRLIAGI